MSTMVTTATFSALLRTPNEVISQLDRGDVLLTRRDAEPLRLSKAQAAAREIDTLAALAQLIAASLDDEAVDRLASRLLDPFPWVEFLPVDVRRQFVDEFVRTARACASVARFERLSVMLAAWEATAEAYADPATIPDAANLEYLTDELPAADPRTAG